MPKTRSRIIAVAISFVTVVAMLIGCAGSEATPTTTSLTTPIQTVAPSPKLTPTPAPEVTPTPALSPSPTPRTLDMDTFREAEKERVGFVDARQDYELLSSIGVRWDRPHPGPFNWGLLEAEYDGRYDWRATDYYVANAQTYGFAFIFILCASIYNVIYSVQPRQYGA